MMATPYWTRVIANAKKRLAKGQVPFTEKNIKKASGWVTCACGKQDLRIKRDKKTSDPFDFRLNELGRDFYGHVDRQLVEGAERILEKIESRAAELIVAQNGPYPREDKNHDDE